MSLEAAKNSGRSQKTINAYSGQSVESVNILTAPSLIIIKCYQEGEKEGIIDS